MYRQIPSLAEAFVNYFDVDLATSSRERDQVARLRYQVYCEEFGYESPAAFPDRRETDEFDPQSLHCLVIHRRSNRVAGCMRLVCADEDNLLPLEAHCLNNIYVEYMDSLTADRNRVCEISRLAVDRSFRKRPGKDPTCFGEYDARDCSLQEQRSFAMIAVAGFLAATALTDLTGRTNVFAMMEPFLPRLMARSGIVFNRVGQDMDYHGLRAPYFITTGLALENMRDDLHVMYDAIHDRLACHYKAIAAPVLPSRPKPDLADYTGGFSLPRLALQV